MTTRLHGWLFDSVSFRSELAAEELERYRTANEYASRFCHRLARRLIEEDQGVLTELRRFYRLSQTDKISHIHSQTLTGG